MPGVRLRSRVILPAKRIKTTGPAGRKLRWGASRAGGILGVAARRRFLMARGTKSSPVGAGVPRAGVRPREVPEALADMAGRKVVGKIIVVA